MDTFSIDEAKTNLSKLVERAARGESFVISDAGKSMVKVVAFSETEPVVRSRIGFLKGRIDVPDDFDELGREEIEKMFYGDCDG